MEAGFTLVCGISLCVITPLHTAIALVMGRITELHSLFQFDSLKKNGICVWRCTEPLQGHMGHTTLASPRQATWEPLPQSTPAARAVRTMAFKQLASQLLNAEVGPG